MLAKFLFPKPCSITFSHLAIVLLAIVLLNGTLTFEKVNVMPMLNRFSGLYKPSLEANLDFLLIYQLTKRSLSKDISLLSGSFFTWGYAGTSISKV